MSELSRSDEPVTSRFVPVAPADMPTAPPARSDGEQVLERIVAISADAVVTIDESLRIVIFNPAAERIFGFPRDEVVGRSIDCLLPTAARDAPLETLRVATTGADAVERSRIWGRRRSGELFLAESTVSPMTVGATTHFVAVIRDLTRERHDEAERIALMRRAIAARSAAEAAERRMAFLADVGEILHSSLAIEETFAALVHLIVPELASCCVVDLLEREGRVRRAHVVHADPAKRELADRLATFPRVQTRYLTRRAIEEGKSELVEAVSDDFLHSVAENEEHLEIFRGLGLSSLVVVPLRSHGRVLGALALARGSGAVPYTPTDLSLAEAVAQRAGSALDNARLYEEARRAVRARDDVLGVVSHDVRTPLSVVAMCATALLGEGFADEVRNRETLETIRRSARWAQRLIQDLIDVRAIDAGGLSLSRRPEDPRMLVTRAILLHGELAADRHIELVAELTAPLPPIDVDADRFVQALGNLIANAVKFTPYGGLVRVGAIGEGDRVRVYVRDSGPGIEPEDAPHVFDRFWTAPRDARARGTGMGLAIVRGIVESHGGSVWLEPPQPDTGATFCIAMPLAPARAG